MIPNNFGNKWQSSDPLAIRKKGCLLEHLVGIDHPGMCALQWRQHQAEGKAWVTTLRQRVIPQHLSRPCIHCKILERPWYLSTCKWALQWIGRMLCLVLRPRWTENS